MPSQEAFKETLEMRHAIPQVGHLVSEIAVKAPQKGENGDDAAKRYPVSNLRH